MEARRRYKNALTGCIMAKGDKKKPKKDDDGLKVVARNRRAKHDYTLEETVEAGIALVGTEVKSLREGTASIAQAYARISGNEVWLLGASIPEYGAGSWTNHQPERKRKLLLHRRQITKLTKAVQKSGRTIVPLQIHFNERGIAKVLLAVATGRKHHDKRQEASKREAQREIRER